MEYSSSNLCGPAPARVLRPRRSSKDAVALQFQSARLAKSNTGFNGLPLCYYQYTDMMHFLTIAGGLLFLRRSDDVMSRQVTCNVGHCKSRARSGPDLQLLICDLATWINPVRRPEISFLISTSSNRINGVDACFFPTFPPTMVSPS